MKKIVSGKGGGGGGEEAEGLRRRNEELKQKVDGAEKEAASLKRHIDNLVSGVDHHYIKNVKKCERSVSKIRRMIKREKVFILILSSTKDAQSSPGNRVVATKGEGYVGDGVEPPRKMQRFYEAVATPGERIESQQHLHAQKRSGSLKEMKKENRGMKEKRKQKR